MLDLAEEPIIRVRGLVNRFGSETVHDGLDLDVLRGEVLGVVGASGSGNQSCCGLLSVSTDQSQGAQRCSGTIF